MLIDSTQEEETRVVVVNGNKLEDVEFETSHRKQIKGNIYLAKVMRVEPSLQACFVDYGGNKHGFLAFGEIHPDYYNLPQEEIDAVDKEVNDIIEAKKQALKEREAERERIREEKAAAYAKRMEEKAKAEAEAAAKAAEQAAQAEQAADIKAENEDVQADAAVQTAENETPATTEVPVQENAPADEETKTEEVLEETTEEKISDEEIAAVAEEEGKKHPLKKRVAKKRIRKKKEELKVLAEDTGLNEDSISDDADDCRMDKCGNDDDDLETDDDDDEQEIDFELQRKLLRARKLFHKSKIQDVIKEGQILLIQVVKEERGNKGAALTTYLSLAGRYCVLMPNRIKSGGVSRKITNVADRKRLKCIVKELPLSTDMSLIVRTAGEEKTRADIVRDYNYLIRSWNMIRLAALKAKAPAMIHEEGNLIKRALRDIYTKEIAEIIVAGDEGYRMAKEFFRILSPHSLKKIKHYRNNEMPLFQRFQVEGQLDKLHEATAQLESGGYLVINPTEALVAIDVNSGRATKEKDLEETALKTNLEACDEIAKQLRMRNLAGLIVIDFIDMEEPANNHAVEKRMKEALKKDRSRIQVAKMSCFGLLEVSRQRMHSSFMESNYQVCPHCHGQGMVRTMESSTVFVLRGIEEEGIKNRSSKINVFVPSDIAINLLNQKRQSLMTLEHKYKMNIVISADDSIQNIADYRIERTKNAAPRTNNEEPAAKAWNNEPASPDDWNEAESENLDAAEENGSNENNRNNENRRNRNRDRNRNNGNRDNDNRGSRNENREEPRQENEPEVNGNGEESNRRENREENNGNGNRRRRDRRNRRGRDRDRRRNGNNNGNNAEGGSNENNGSHSEEKPYHHEKKQEAVILYNSHEDNTSSAANDSDDDKKAEKGKTTWWKKLIKS